MRAIDNPFRSSAIASLRYRISAAKRSALLQRFIENRWQGCIRGPHGTGKSTLLEDLATQIDSHDIRWIILHRNSAWAIKLNALRKLLLAKPCALYCVDGAEALGLPIWSALSLWLRARGTKVLATTHHVCFLRSVLVTEKNQALMLTITRELAGSHWNRDLQQIAFDAFQRNHGNMREVFRACYLHLATLTSLKNDA